MDEEWIPPKSHYVRDHALFDKEAKDAVDRVADELQSKVFLLREHDLTFQKSETWLEVKRGVHEFLSINFNFDFAGSCRIVDYVAMRLHRQSHFDFVDAAAGEAAFKKQFKAALDAFYENRQVLAALVHLRA